MYAKTRSEENSLRNVLIKKRTRKDVKRLKTVAGMFTEADGEGRLFASGSRGRPWAD